MKNEDLYHPIIIDRNKNPLFFGENENGLLIEAYNPVCGDEFNIRISLIDGRISAPTFYGYGCAISKASIDMILEKLNGTKIDIAISILQDYLSLLNTELPPETETNQLSVFQRVKYHPSRLECATLGANSLLSTLENLKT